MTNLKMSCVAVLGGLLLGAAAPRVAQADFQQGLVLLQQKYYNEAAAEFAAEAKKNKKVDKTWYYLGLSYLGAKKYNEAASAFSTAIELKPGSFDYQIHLAKSYLGAKNYSAAASAFEKAYPLASDADGKFESAYYQGQALMAQGKYAESADALRKALNIKGSYKVAETLAKAEFKSGDFEGAAKAYESASRYKSTFDALQGATYSYLKLAYNAGKAGDEASSKTYWAQAAKWGGKASAAKPSDVKMAALYANALFRSEKYGDAVGAYDKAIKLAPADCDLMTEKGLSEFKLKKYSDAEGTLKGAIACDSKNHSAYSYLGYTYNAMAKPKQKKGVEDENIDMIQASIDLRTEALKNLRQAKDIKSSSSLDKMVASIQTNIKNSQENIETILENRQNDAEFAAAKAEYERKKAEFEDYEGKRQTWSEKQGSAAPAGGGE